MPARMRIGVDLGGTKIEAIALDSAGKITLRQRCPTPTGDYQGTVHAVRDLVAWIESHLPGDEPRPLTVGVGIPGSISPASGLVRNANSTWLIGQPFDKDLTAALERPVRVSNDANCFAVSEASDGAAAGATVVFGVIIGTGVGGGVVVNGRAVEGVNGIGGEWGHNPLPWPREEERPGPACFCGQNGCMETFVSGVGLARDHLAVTGQKLRAHEIASAAQQGDAAAQASLERYEDRLARGLATIMNVVDPEVIVLGGGMSNVARLYQNVPRLWAKYVFSDVVRTRLVPPMHGDSSGVRGAAWLWPLEA